MGWAREGREGGDKPHLGNILILWSEELLEEKLETDVYYLLYYNNT